MTESSSDTRGALLGFVEVPNNRPCQVHDQEIGYWRSKVRSLIAGTLSMAEICSNWGDDCWVWWVNDWIATVTFGLMTAVRPKSHGSTKYLQTWGLKKVVLTRGRKISGLVFGWTDTKLGWRRGVKLNMNKAVNRYVCSLGIAGKWNMVSVTSWSRSSSICHEAAG